MCMNGSIVIGAQSGRGLLLSGNNFFRKYFANGLEILVENTYSRSLHQQHKSTTCFCFCKCLEHVQVGIQEQQRTFYVHLFCLIPSQASFPLQFWTCWYEYHWKHCKSRTVMRVSNPSNLSHVTVALPWIFMLQMLFATARPFAQYLYFRVFLCIYVTWWLAK